MKAVDTNILARFFIDNPEDSEAAVQKPLAVFVPMTVILEFEWVMRSFYKLSRADIRRVSKRFNNFNFNLTPINTIWQISRPC